MHLSRDSDYGLRVLVFLTLRDAKLTTTEQIAAAYGISHAHLKQVVRKLAQLAYLESLPGRSGGLLLGMNPRRSASATSCADWNLISRSPIAFREPDSHRRGPKARIMEPAPASSPARAR